MAMTRADDKRAAVRAALKRERARVMRVLVWNRSMYLEGIGVSRHNSDELDRGRVQMCEDLIKTLGGPEALARVKRRESRRG